MERTLVTKAIGFLVLKGLKFLASKTDNKVDDYIVAAVDDLIFGGKNAG